MLGRDKKMNPGRYFIPNMGMGMQMGPMMNGMAPMTRGVGLFGRIGNTLKSINFSGLLSGANKTLNVVNQTIPPLVVRLFQEIVIRAIILKVIVIQKLTLIIRRMRI